MTPEPRVRLAAVQAASVFLDLDASVEKACELIREAGEHGATVVGFPEGFLPGHPVWYHFIAASSPKSMDYARRLAENAIEIPGPAVTRLRAAAAAAGVFVVMGCCERAPGRPGTLYNTLLFIDSRGELLGRHHKLIPTLGEQLVHAQGDAVGLHPYPFSGSGLVSGLMCGENSNPLATFALDAQGTTVHVASWPAFFQMGADMSDIILMVSKALAYQMKTYIINAVGAVTEEMIDELCETEEQREFLRAQKGSASIIGPWGQVIAGPMPQGEGIVYADAPLEALTVPNLVHDFGGRYNRFDLLHLEMSRGGYPAIGSARPSPSPTVDPWPEPSPPTPSSTATACSNSYALGTGCS